MDEAKTRYDGLVNVGKGLTDTKKIADNKKLVESVKGDYDVASSRAAELKESYLSKVEEKEALEEEEAFQKLIEEGYKKGDELVKAI